MLTRILGILIDIKRDDRPLNQSIQPLFALLSLILQTYDGFPSYYISLRSGGTDTLADSILRIAPVSLVHLIAYSGVKKYFGLLLSI